MASYNYTADTDFQALNKTFKRVESTQLMDATSMFNSYTDAVKYAKGNRRDPDERRLYRASYVGQVITVYENGDISQYKINESRDLVRLIPIEAIKVNGQEVEAGVDASVDLDIPELVSTESVRIVETTGNTQEVDVVKIDCGEY